MKKYLSILFVFVAVFMLTACSTKDSDAKTFTEDDFEITLNKGFEKKTLTGIIHYYENEEMKVGVTVNSESRQAFKNAGIDFPDDVKSYAEFVVTANSLTDSKVVSKGKYAQFSYKRTNNGKEYYYYATTHKAGDAYYLVNFFCESSKASEYQEQFAKWADSITVK